MVDVIDGLLAALAGLPLWALAAAVVVVMALEASLLTGVVVPGDLVVLFAASTATSPTRFVVLWAAVAAGSVLGETVGYGIGRGFGERVQASRVGRWLGQARWARAAEFLRRRGARAVFASRFLAAVHAVLPIVAGTVRMGYRRFLAAAVVGALTWSALYMTIGALAGASYRAVADRLNEVSGVIAGGLIGAALFGRGRPDPPGDRSRVQHPGRCRRLVEGDPLGVEAFSAAALLPTLALLGDAAYRRRATAGQADAVVDSRGPPGA